MTDKQMGFTPDLKYWVNNRKYLEGIMLPPGLSTTKGDKIGICFECYDAIPKIFSNRDLRLIDESLYGVNPYDAKLSNDVKKAVARRS